MPMLTRLGGHQMIHSFFGKNRLNGLFSNPALESRSRMHRFFRRTDIGILIGCIFIFILFSLWNHDQWFNWYTFTSISRYTAILGLLAIGQTFVILIREIDLSVGSVYGAIGIAFISLEHQLSVPLSAFLALLFALTIGLINAVIVIHGRLSSMIVTLGGLFFYGGLVNDPTQGGVGAHRRGGVLVGSA